MIVSWKCSKCGFIQKPGPYGFAPQLTDEVRMAVGDYVVLCDSCGTPHRLRFTVRLDVTPELRLDVTQ